MHLDVEGVVDVEGKYLKRFSDNILDFILLFSIIFERTFGLTHEFYIFY